MFVVKKTVKSCEKYSLHKGQITFTTLKYLCTNHGDQRVLFQFEIILSRSSSFNHLCYGSTAILNIFILSESDVYRRHILTYKQVRVQPCIDGHPFISNRSVGLFPVSVSKHPGVYKRLANMTGYLYILFHNIRYVLLIRPDLV